MSGIEVEVYAVRKYTAFVSNRMSLINFDQYRERHNFAFLRDKSFEFEREVDLEQAQIRERHIFHDDPEKNERLLDGREVYRKETVYYAVDPELDKTLLLDISRVEQLEDEIKETKFKLEAMTKSKDNAVEGMRNLMKSYEKAGFIQRLKWLFTGIKMNEVEK
jgi:hypothetical protein